MTTINRDRDNSGRCHTVGAGSLLTSSALYAEARVCQDAGHEFSDTAAATVASWWHGPSGDGVVFSRLSHRMAGGSDVIEVLDAIYRAQRELDTVASAAGSTPAEIAEDRLALNMMSTWAMNGPGFPAV